MTIIIIGSRTIDSPEAKEWLKSQIEAQNPIQIITGGNTKGVSKMAKEIAKSLEIELIEMLPDYAKYGRIAPHLRNDEMIKFADLVLCIWDTQSKGTEHEIKLCKKYRKKLITYLTTKTEQNSLF